MGSLPADSVIAEALRLPVADRAKVATLLIDSLEANDDSGVADAWNQEILQRMDEIRSGHVVTLPWHEARRQILDDSDDSA